MSLPEIGSDGSGLPGNPSAEEHPLRPGEILGSRFRVCDFLGRGGMGEVFAAQDTLLRTMVAIKVVRAEFVASEMARQRLIREVNTARSLTHPNICRVFDFEEAISERGTKVSFLTMELLHGETLSERLSRKPKLTAEETARIASQICDAFCALHAQGIIHRDFKPSNAMLIQEAGGLRAVVMDFGLSLAASVQSEDLTRLSVGGSAVGTPAYMAPEQLQGLKVTPASDIYSLGIVFGEMVTGLDVDSLLDRSSFPSRLELTASALLRYKNGKWHHIVERCLAPKAERRYATAHELRSDLTRSRPDFLNFRIMLVAALAIVLVSAVWLFAASGTWRRFTSGQAPTQGRMQTDAPAMTTGAAVVMKTPHEELEAARARLSRYDRGDNLDAAIQMLSHTIERYPTFAPAYADLSQAYLLRNTTAPDVRWQSLADSLARRAVALNPELALSHVALAGALHRAGSEKEAIEEYQQALKLDPKSAKAYMGLAQCSARLGEKSQAEAYFRQATELAPDDWLMWGSYGVFEYSAGHYANASAALQRAEQLAPDNSTLHRNLGAIYSKLGRYDDAASEFQRALEIRPSDALYTNLGTIRFYQGRYSDAIAPMQAAVKLSANNYLNWGNLADAYRLTPGHAREAIDAYRIASQLAQEQIQKAPDDPDTRSSLADYLAFSGDTAAARNQLKALDGVKQHTPSSLFKAALASEACQRTGDALRYLASAIREGYPLLEIRTNPDLAALRRSPEFQLLTLRGVEQEAVQRQGQSRALVNK